jgi:hypothetical protein
MKQEQYSNSESVNYVVYLLKICLLRALRIQHNEFHDLYFSPNIIRIDKDKEDEIGGACSTYEECILVGKPEGRRLLGRPRRRWVGNMKTDLREIGWDGMVWTGSIWRRIGISGGLL